MCDLPVGKDSPRPAGKLFAGQPVLHEFDQGDLCAVGGEAAADPHQHVSDPVAALALRSGTGGHAVTFNGYFRTPCISVFTILDRPFVVGSFSTHGSFSFPLNGEIPGSRAIRLLRFQGDIGLIVLNRMRVNPSSGSLYRTNVLRSSKTIFFTVYGL
jgi:hypothetical protein